MILPALSLNQLWTTEKAIYLSERASSKMLSDGGVSLVAMADRSNISA